MGRAKTKKYDKRIIRSLYNTDFTNDKNTKGLKRNHIRKKPKDMGIFN